METRIESISKAMGHLDEARKALGCEFDYTMAQLANCRRLLITKYAPFPLGSWVALNKNWTTNDPNSGWHSSQHFLIKGAVAKVVDVEVYRAGDLKYCLVFENESWMDDKGEVRQIKDKHQYTFSGEWLELLNHKENQGPVNG